MNSKKNQGFTLIEVVVVMAIIAVLASLVVGAIRVARNTATETVNRSNVKTVQTCLEAYYARHGAYCKSGTNNVCVAPHIGISLTDVAKHLTDDGIPCSLSATSAPNSGAHMDPLEANNFTFCIYYATDYSSCMTILEGP